MKKTLYGPKVHGILDYLSVATLLAAPSLLDLRSNARTVSYAFGISALVLNGLTKQPYAFKPVIPARVHGQIDTPFVPILVLLPWLTGALQERTARLFFVSFCLAAFTNYLLTDYEAS